MDDENLSFYNAIIYPLVIKVDAEALELLHNLTPVHLLILL